ncbi:MAG: Lipopolysaccharide assembly protein B [Stenotrophomonas maltophilia]|nr:MAG: Lipopolysaccharide assembly protein B [Stenotrophomonas maltophilia]
MPIPHQILSVLRERLTRWPRLGLVLGGLALLLVVAGVAVWRLHAPALPPPTTSSEEPRIPARFVDEQRCQACHASQVKDWQGSHHQRALQPADSASILGDFADASFKDAGGSRRFFRRDQQFWVNVPLPDGHSTDYQVAYSIGVEPFQQYLLALPDGRLQALDVAWDSQQQRWFQPDPQQALPAGGQSHWTRADSANATCLDCHTTGLQRGFDASQGRYDSHWAVDGVGCQACHGPASGHLAWAASPDNRPSKGFNAPLGPSSSAPEQVERCARCHAPRTPLGDGQGFSAHLLDDYLPSLLTRELYQIDGKINGEAYEWGSFTQSAMFASGVACSDCHQPHSGELRGSGNGVCLQCHAPNARLPADIDGRNLKTLDYDSPAHTHHAPGSAGAQCTACHMPGKYYHGVDYRHDHSFSLPDPLHAQRIGTPDACQGCHRDTASRVAEQFRLWYARPAASPPSASAPPRFDEALLKARQGLPGASRALHLLLASPSLPAIQRATLLEELRDYPSPGSQDLAAKALAASDPLVRRAAVRAVGALAPAYQQVSLLTPLLQDPIRAVRLAATRELLRLPAPQRASLPPTLEHGVAEYEATYQAQADQPRANLSLARLYQALGRDAEAEAALRAALTRDPDYLPALSGLAQWLDHHQRGPQALELLRDALKRQPQAASLHYALGRLLQRQASAEALRELQEAVRLAPFDARARMNLAMALHDAGQNDAARHELDTLVQQQPANREARLLLVGYLRETGQMQQVQQLLAELEQLNPDDPVLHGE